LNEWILPWGTGVDVMGLHRVLTHPLAHFFGDELSTVIATDVFGVAELVTGLLQISTNLWPIDLVLGPQSDAIAAVLVHEAEDLDGAPIFSPVEDEVPSPNIITLLGFDHARRG